MGHQTTEQLQVSQQQLYTLSVSYEQLRLSKVSEVNNDNTDNGAAVTELRSKLETAEQSIKSINSEQEDLLVMLSEQEETIKKYKTRLRELGENIVSDEDEDDDEDLT